MKYAIALVFILTASIASSQSLTFKLLGSAYTVLNTVDAVQTAALKDRVELNPIMRSIANKPLALGIVKAAAPLAFNKYTELLRKNGHSKLAWTLRIAAVGVQTAVVTRAAIQMR